MKSIFLKVCLIFFFASAGLINAQEPPKLHTVELDKARDNFAIPYDLIVHPGDSVNFISINGEFAIFINDAWQLFEDTESKLKIKVNNPTPESDIYVVVSVDGIVEEDYTIYCITDNSWPESWPDAPPRIIIIASE